jgi:predicted tellurium resistance membrane protein TerC
LEWLFDSQTWIALITLTILEIILGIDNIVVISILAQKLPVSQQAKARTIGLGLALLTRILLLLSLSWLASLTNPLFSLSSLKFSTRDLILLTGGLFLLWKATREIHHAMEIPEAERQPQIVASMAGVIMQIILLDIVFSLDSVITAIGMAQRVEVMIAAIVIAIFVMLLGSGAISGFIHQHPSVKILALSFLLLIGVTLIAEGFTLHIPKGYIYFAMGFSGAVETINLMAAHRRALQRRMVLSQDQADV